MTHRLVGFESWMRKVDSLIAAAAGGLTSGEIEDCPYLEWYEQHLSPAAAAKRAIRRAKE